MKAIFIVVAAAVMATPAPASDFSRLAKPGFARGLLLSADRQHELSCVALATARVRLKRGGSATDAAAMSDALRALLTVELGDAAEARDLVEQRSSVWGPHSYDSRAEAAQRLKVVDAMSAQCAPLDDKFRTGGAAGFRAALSPSGGLISLLPLPECIALAERSAREGGAQSFFHAQDIEELQASIDEGRTISERAALRQAVAASQKSLDGAKMDPRSLSMRALSCLAVFSQLVGRKSGDPAHE